MNTFEDSVVRRLIMALSYIVFQTKALLEDEDSNGLPLWARFSMRLKVNLDQDQLGLLAAGVAFYFLMAAFPALAVLVSLYALIADPADMATQMNMLGRFLPRDSLNLLTDQVVQLANATDGTLSISLVLSLLFTFYAASKGMRVLIKGFNIAYDCHERRNIFLRSFVAYTLTIGLIVYMLASLILIAGIPAVFQIISFPDMLSDAYVWLRWPVLFFMALLGLEILYTWGPAEKPNNKKTFSIGAIAATILWVAASSLFSLFVTHFGRYNQTYGSLSAVVVLLLWFWLSALMILLGAEINAAYKQERDR